MGARKESYVTIFCNQTWCCDTSCKTSGAVLMVKVTVLGGYKDIYLPVTLKCGLEFVFVALHSESALRNKTAIQLAMHKQVINKM